MSLNLAKLDRYQLRWLRDSSFEELIEQAYPTLQKEVLYHRGLGLWIAEDRTETHSGYPEDDGRLLTRTEHALRTFAGQGETP